MPLSIPIGESITRFAWWTGIVSLLMTLLMMLAIVAARFVFLRRLRAREAFFSLWRPFFVRCMFEEPKNIPPLRGEGRFYFLQLFTHYHSLVKGEDRERLNALARMAGIRPYAYLLLKSGPQRKKIVAAYALGYLRLTDAVPSLKRGLHGQSAVLSMACGFALVTIDPAEGVRSILPLVWERPDWTPAALHRLLARAGKEAVSPPLREMVMGLEEEKALPFIKLLDLANEEAVEECVAYWLERYKRDETLATCLQRMKSPRHLALVRGLLSSPVWYLRVQAASVLGRMGERSDLPLMTAMLSDPEWWVRYRAAKAIVEFPYLSTGDLRRLADGLTDRFARDIMEHVLAEAQVEAR